MSDNNYHPDYLDPHGSKGLHLRRLDQKRADKENLELIGWLFQLFRCLLIVSPILVPLLIIGGVIKALHGPEMPNAVRIRELNWRKFEGSEEHIYATVGSIEEAEDWLLKRGYKYRLIYTRGKYEYGGDHDSYLKRFPVKGKAHSLDESVISLDVDYGDGDIHRLPFRTLPGESGIDFSRFERSWKGRMPEHPMAFNTLAFELGYVSTHNWTRGYSTGNWPSGGYDVEEGEKNRIEAKGQAKLEAEEERVHFQRQVEDALN